MKRSITHHYALVILAINTLYCIIAEVLLLLWLHAFACQKSNVAYVSCHSFDFWGGTEIHWIYDLVEIT